eukprot:108577-Amorphochlora_amoeboformis.AAC.1
MYMYTNQSIIFASFPSVREGVGVSFKCMCYASLFQPSVALPIDLISLMPLILPRHPKPKGRRDGGEKASLSEKNVKRKRVSRHGKDGVQN